MVGVTLRDMKRTQCIGKEAAAALVGFEKNPERPLNELCRPRNA